MCKFGTCNLNEFSMRKLNFNGKKKNLPTSVKFTASIQSCHDTRCTFALVFFFFGLFGFAGDLEKVEVLIFCGVCVCVFFLFG